uniref:hypothetical protein n=1 Tax=Megamonas funiformis TaxID=437897 RepID=UPI003AF948F4
KNNIDKDIATTRTDTIVRIIGKDNIINANTAIDNIDGGNIEIIASENNSIDGLVHAENKANTKIQGKVNYLKNMIMVKVLFGQMMAILILWELVLYKPILNK